MSYIESIVETFGESEKICYYNFTSRDKSMYSSYVSAIDRYSIKKALMPPSEWKFQKDERDALTDFGTIAKALGLNSPQHAYTYYTLALTHILKIIRKNPKKYATLAEIGELLTKKGGDYNGRTKM